MIGRGAATPLIPDLTWIAQPEEDLRGSLVVGSCGIDDISRSWSGLIPDTV